jgi:RHS repeat-associated protein
LDAETGNYNIGVRQNDPKLGIWTSTEPKWQDYPQWSGYISMGNNPISYVDKDGREIWLAFYGVNGKREEVIKYTPCMKYNGSNQFIASTIERLNKINSVKNGGILLDKLSSSTNKYVYSNLILPNNENAGAATTSKKNGEIYFLMGKNPSLMKDAHELFHGWQIDNNFGGETDQNEVEAYLFGNSVAWNYAMSNPMDVESQNILKSFSFDFGNNRNKFSLLKLEQQFNKAFNSLLDSKASDFQINGNYQTAISTFRCGSIFNANGLYDDNLSIPLHKPLIFEFIPLIEDN